MFKEVQEIIVLIYIVGQMKINLLLNDEGHEIMKHGVQTHASSVLRSKCFKYVSYSIAFA